MINIKKELNFKVIFTIIVLVFGFVYHGYALRPPIDTEQTKARIGVAQGKVDLTFGFGSDDPRKHNPFGKWKYLTHTGISRDPDKNLQKLIALLKDVSKAKDEIFCCFETSSVNPRTWRLVGFILGIPKGEVLYAGKLRDQHRDSGGTHKVIYPLRLPVNKREKLKNDLRKNRFIDTAIIGSKYPDYPKEIDVTGAEITGVCVNIQGWRDKRVEGFIYLDFLDSELIILAIAVKYKLPIVITMPKTNLLTYQEYYDQFEGLVERAGEKRRILDAFKKQGIDFPGSAAILNQVVPKPAELELKRYIPSIFGRSKFFSNLLYSL